MLSVDEYGKKLEKSNFDKFTKILFEQTTRGETTNYKNVSVVLKKLLSAILHNHEYNKNIILTSDEALKKYKFNWVEFAKEIGYKKVPNEFLCKNVNYLKNCTELLLNEWNSEEWRDYWIWIYVRFMARLTKKWSKIFFEYYGKELHGQREEQPNNIRCISLCCYVFNKFINHIYLDQYVDPIKVDFIKNLGEDLKIVFKRIIMRNNWMNTKTKNYALQKIDALKILLVKPPSFADDPPLSETEYYKSDELINNLFKYTYWRTNYLINLVGKSIRAFPVVSWSDYPFKFTSYQSFVVNASYIPSINSIYIPAAYIQKPFVDLDNRTISYNMATIGFTIAHELSHALDDKGSKFDIDGNLNNWWTPEDKKKYKLIQKNILKQYEEWAKKDGLKYNASSSIGEDIADISAIAICDEFLRDYLFINRDSIPGQIAFFQLFFIHFAVNMRQKLINEESRMLSNPHPPDNYRCNIPLSRSIIFRAIYDIKKGDKMWWPSTNQVW
jgi:putative endopeptidase